MTMILTLLAATLGKENDDKCSLPIAVTRTFREPKIPKNKIYHPRGWIRSKLKFQVQRIGLYKRRRRNCKRARTPKLATFANYRTTTPRPRRIVIDARTVGIETNCTKSSTVRPHWLNPRTEHHSAAYKGRVFGWNWVLRVFSNKESLGCPKYDVPIKHRTPRRYDCGGHTKPKDGRGERAVQWTRFVAT